MARADWLDAPAMGHLLAALMPANRLVLMVQLQTGLRCGDVLRLRRADLEKGQRFTVREEKTGKGRRVYLPKELHARLMAQCGRWWVFEHRTDPHKHRTRAAVYKDLQRAAAAFRRSGIVPRGAHVGTHTARKMWAVDEYQRSDLAAVQRKMNHTSPEITMLYALADSLSASTNAPPIGRTRAGARAGSRGAKAPGARKTRPAERGSTRARGRALRERE